PLHVHVRPKSRDRLAPRRLRRTRCRCAGTPTQRCPPWASYPSSGRANPRSTSSPGLLSVDSSRSEGRLRRPSWVAPASLGALLARRRHEWGWRHVACVVYTTTSPKERRPSRALPTRLRKQGYGSGDAAHALVAQHLARSLLRPAPGRMDLPQEAPTLGSHTKLGGASVLGRCGLQPAPVPHPVHIPAQGGLLQVEHASHSAGARRSHLRHRDEHAHLADLEPIGSERLVVDGGHGAVEQPDLVRNALAGHGPDQVGVLACAHRRTGQIVYTTI